jgi:restriction endonuclease S subunit
MLFRYVPVCLAAIDVAFNQDIKALTVSTSINTNFLLYQIIFSQSRILINATGIGAGKIESDHLSGFEVSIPQYTEQKKIADCLSSLYAVIAAEKERLATLRTHKKGLMQALSRALGHTIPRLRFPEFQDAGDWKEREVGDVFTVTRGNVLAMPLVDDLPTERKPYPVYSSQTKRNGLAGYYSAYLYDYRRCERW